MKNKTIYILVGGYLALSVASLVGSQMWLKKFIKNLDEPKKEEILEEEEA